MLITKNRIRNIDRYLSSIKDNDIFVVGVSNISRFSNQLTTAGFTSTLEIGERILPSDSFGPITRFNAEGKYVPNKNLPKETAYQTRIWHWTEWHGNERVVKSKIVDVPYERYPRTFIPPVSIELVIGQDLNLNKLVVSDKLIKCKSECEKITHTVNLFLEIFGEAEILDKNLNTLFTAPMKRLNWNVLPVGQMPWSNLKKLLQPILNKAPHGNRGLILDRFKKLNNFNPDFHAIGHAGFYGYVIFGFPQKNIFICESTYSDNATYVFEDDWEKFSKLTKAEILDNNYQKARIIHRKNWHSEVKNIII